MDKEIKHKRNLLVEAYHLGKNKKELKKKPNKIKFRDENINYKKFFKINSAEAFGYF